MALSGVECAEPLYNVVFCSFMSHGAVVWKEEAAEGWRFGDHPRRLKVKAFSTFGQQRPKKVSSAAIAIAVRLETGFRLPWSSSREVPSCVAQRCPRESSLRD